MKKSTLRTIILIVIILNLNFVYGQKSFNLNSNHDYPTYLDIQFKDDGKALGAFQSYSAEVRNISSSKISFGLEFIVTDNCGNSHKEFFAGKTDLMPGDNGRHSGEIQLNDCKTYGIASVTCRVINFKNLTKEANDYKEKQVKEQQKRDEEKALRQKLENDKIKKEAEARKNNTSVENEDNTTNTNSTQTATSYYSTQKTNNPNAAVYRQPTWQETNERINAENQQKYQEQQARIAQTQQANKEAGEKFVSDASELIGMVGNIIQQNREAKEKKEAYRAEEARKDKERRQEEADKAAELARYVAQRLALRKTLIDEYSDGAVPLSSQKMGTPELFYFTYIFDENTIAESRPAIKLSNIFSVIQYADGTWPFKSAIQKDIKKIAPTGTVTLVGYYTTKELALEARKDFIDKAGLIFFELTDIVYERKKINSQTADDFWGDKPENNSKIKSTQDKGDDDFWGTKTDTKPEVAGKGTLRPGGMGDEDFSETVQYKKKLSVENKKVEAKKTEPKTAAAKVPLVKKVEEKKPVKKDDFWNN